VKGNVDGAVSSNNRVGSVATIFRTSDGVYLGSSAVIFPGVTDPPTLETLACRKSLALATDLMIDDIVVASDCKQVVKDLTSLAFRSSMKDVTRIEMLIT
jgi:ribonuclease HI